MYSSVCDHIAHRVSVLQVDPNACPMAGKCGGCQLQNMDYEHQLRWKQSRVNFLLKKLDRPEPIIGMAEPAHYCNKVQSAFARTRSEKITNENICQFLQFYGTMNNSFTDAEKKKPVKSFIRTCGR